MMVDSRNLSRARSDTMAAHDGDDNSTRGTIQQQPTPYYPRLAQEMLSKNQKSKHPVSRNKSRAPLQAFTPSCATFAGSIVL